jgi:hypothetical protein
MPGAFFSAPLTGRAIGRSVMVQPFPAPDCATASPVFPGGETIIARE